MPDRLRYAWENVITARNGIHGVMRQHAGAHDIPSGC
jgi:hypothetical protein